MLASDPSLLCALCRSSLDASAVSCRRHGCSARYHADCWAECEASHGSCAVLSCASQRARGVEEFIPRPPRPPAFAVLLVGTIFIATVAGAWMNGFLGPRYRQVDVLANPARVTTWTKTGIVLDDGRTVALPGIKTITAPTSSLMRLVERGVDIEPDGRVGVLVRIYTGCGTRPGMKERRLEFDLSVVLVYVGAAEPVAGFTMSVQPSQDARERLDDARLSEFWVTIRHGQAAALETLCNDNAIPLFPHAEPELASFW